MRLARKTSLVTGAASGIGKAIAQAFVREGAAVAVLDINRAKGESVVADLNRQGGRTCFVECDVGQARPVTAAFEEALLFLGRLDILVNNTGVIRFSKIVDMPEEAWDFILRTNLKSVFLCSQQGARQMIKQGGGGRIIAISSIHAVLSEPNCGHYMWVGDSRVYRLRDVQFEQVTRDHSEVQEMIDRGQISTEEAATAANANVMTRAVGGTSELHVELALTELRDGDRYLLCSDGLFKEVPDRDLAADLAGDTTPREACDALLARTLAGPCSDNVTAVVVMIVGGDEFDQTGQFSIAPPTA